MILANAYANQSVTMKQTFALIGFREDGAGKVHAAFRAGPLGAYKFELPAPPSLLKMTPVDQERWAQQAIHSRGQAYDGLHLSDPA